MWAACNFKWSIPGLPWRSSGSDAALPLQGSVGLIPGRRTKVPHALLCSQKNKNK